MRAGWACFTRMSFTGRRGKFLSANSRRPVWPNMARCSRPSCLDAGFYQFRPPDDRRLRIGRFGDFSNVDQGHGRYHGAKVFPKLPRYGSEPGRSRRFLDAELFIASFFGTAGTLPGSDWHSHLLSLVTSSPETGNAGANLSKCLTGSLPIAEGWDFPWRFVTRACSRRNILRFSTGMGYLTPSTVGRACRRWRNRCNSRTALRRLATARFLLRPREGTTSRRLSSFPLTLRSKIQIPRPNALIELLTTPAKPGRPGRVSVYQ